MNKLDKLMTYMQFKIVLSIITLGVWTYTFLYPNFFTTRIYKYNILGLPESFVEVWWGWLFGLLFVASIIWILWDRRK